jgi:hypothetical protein
MEKLQTKSTAEKAWARIGESWPITEEVVRKINGRRVVSSDDLVRLWGIAKSTLNEYVSAKGMPKHPCSAKLFSVFDFAEVVAWRSENIMTDHGNSITVKLKHEAIGFVPEMGAGMETDDQLTKRSDMMRKASADADRAEEDAIIARLKREQLEESLIDADDLDIALAELATIYQTTYSNDKKILPVHLKGKTDVEIRKYLDEYYENRMSDLNRLINKSFPNGVTTMYEVILVIMEKIREGSSPDEIIGKL